ERMAGRRAVDVPAVAVLRGDPDVAGVVDVGGPVGPHRHGQVHATVGLQQPGVGRDGRQRRVPGGAVVLAGLPRVHQAHQAVAGEVPAAAQVLVLGDQPGVEPGQLVGGALPAGGVGGAAVQLPGGDRVHRRLHDPAGGVVG